MGLFIGLLLLRIRAAIQSDYTEDCHFLDGQNKIKFALKNILMNFLEFLDFVTLNI